MRQTRTQKLVFLLKFKTRYQVLHNNKTNLKNRVKHEIKILNIEWLLFMTKFITLCDQMIHNSLNMDEVHEWQCAAWVVTIEDHSVEIKIT